MHQLFLQAFFFLFFLRLRQNPQLTESLGAQSKSKQSSSIVSARNEARMLKY
jgi:hypothetical protein